MLLSFNSLALCLFVSVLYISFQFFFKMGLLWWYIEIAELHYSLIAGMYSKETVRDVRQQMSMRGHLLQQRGTSSRGTNKIPKFHCPPLLHTLVFQCHYLKCYNRVNVIYFYNTNEGFESLHDLACKNKFTWSCFFTYEHFHFICFLIKVCF